MKNPTPETYVIASPNPSIKESAAAPGPGTLTATPVTPARAVTARPLKSTRARSKPARRKAGPRR